ncbi:MAG: helix-turn-helix domain-containing protein [Lachnospiraceae bacterium]|nr:helix-turn-helix domain-containing protein [Lachnospiraceae bacterium]
MTKAEMVNRYTALARRRTEILLQSCTGSSPELEQEERIILQEMAALETAMRLPVEEEKKVPEMLTIKEVARRTGLSYDFIRKMCLLGKIVHIRIGSKYLINMGKLVDFLNGMEANA